MHQIKIEWSPFPEELLISLTLAMIDRIPCIEKKIAVVNEIKRLESVGESIIEHVFAVFTITKKEDNWSIHFTKLEKLR